MATNAGKNQAASRESASTTQAAQGETAAKADATKTQSKSTYEVKDGDSLESVAREVGMEPTDIAALNPEIAAEGRGSNFLYTGQTLRLK